MREKEKSRNVGNKLFFLMIIGGYVFFLTSRIWLPDFREMVEVTPYYQELRLPKHTVYVTQWDYASREGVMEIVLEIKSDELIDDGLSYEVLERKAGELNVEAVAREADYMILRVTGIPEKWKEISLRLQEEGEAELLKLYTNVSEVNRVSSLPRKESVGYVITRLQGQIGYDSFQISDRLKQIEELEEENKKLTERIEEMEGGLYPTQKEAEQAENLIASAAAEIEGNHAETGILENEIQELENRSKEIEKQIEQLQ